MQTSPKNVIFDVDTFEMGWLVERADNVFF